MTIDIVEARRVAREAVPAERQPHAVVQGFAVSADGYLEAAPDEEPLIVDDACIVREHGSLRPIGLGDGEVLGGEIPAEARNSLMRLAAARAPSGVRRAVAWHRRDRVGSALRHDRS